MYLTSLDGPNESFFIRDFSLGISLTDHLSQYARIFPEPPKWYLLSHRDAAHVAELEDQVLMNPG